MSVKLKQNKAIRNFNETFWLKIRDELRIYVIQEKRPKKILKLYELGEEDLCVDRKKVRQWSEQAEILVNEIMENGYADFICNRDHIREVFKNLNFIRLQIKEMDEELLNFPNIEVLNLNKNLITTVENVPRSLKELHLFSNHVTQIHSRLKTADNLLYLGLGYNQLRDEGLINISRFFPQLVGLDISNNFLEDIELILENVEKIKKLKLFNAYGNPISLLPNYKKIFMNALTDLEIIDNKRIGPNDRTVSNEENNKKISSQNIDQEYLQEAKYDSLKPVVNNVQTIQYHPLHSFKLRIAVTTLENLPEGIILEKSMYPKYDEKPEQFQTCYYCMFELDAFGNDEENNTTIDSRPKVIERLHKLREKKVKDRLEYIRKQEEEQKKQAELLAQQALQAQSQAGKKGAKPPAPAKGAKDAGKIDIPPEIPPVNGNLEGRAMSEDICKDDEINRVDMQIDFEQLLPINTRIRDFFRKGLIVRLYKSEPTMVQVAEGDEEKQPQINPDTGYPVLTESQLGVFKIDLEQFLNDATMPRISQYKYPIFLQNILKVPEYFYPLEDELKLLKNNNEVVQNLIKQQEDAEKPPEPEAVDPKKKDPKKKDVKKVDKKPPPAKKGGKEEEQKKVVPLSTFPSHSRQYIFVDQQNIHLPLRKFQISALVEIV